MAGEFPRDLAAAVAAQSERILTAQSRLLQGSLRLAITWYNFQDLRLTSRHLWKTWTALRGSDRPVVVRPSYQPLYGFERMAAGVPRMVRRPGLSGADGRTWLQCRTERLPEAPVLHVEGEADLAAAESLANALETVIDGERRVIVDLSRLSYLDGSGINVLTEAVDAHPDVTIVVVGSKPEIHRLFDILELNEVFPVVPSIDAARDFLRTQ